MIVRMKLADLLKLYNRTHTPSYPAYRTTLAKTIVKDALAAGKIAPDGQGYYKLTSQKLEEAKQACLKRRD